MTSQNDKMDPFLASENSIKVKSRNLMLNNSEAHISSDSDSHIEKSNQGQNFNAFVSTK
jgi:hypothetical protein